MLEVLPVCLRTWRGVVGYGIEVRVIALCEAASLVGSPVALDSVDERTALTGASTWTRTIWRGRIGMKYLGEGGWIVAAGQASVLVRCVDWTLLPFLISFIVASGHVTCDSVRPEPARAG